MSRTRIIVKWHRYGSRENGNLRWISYDPPGFVIYRGEPAWPGRRYQLDYSTGTPTATTVASSDKLSNVRYLANTLATRDQFVETAVELLWLTTGQPVTSQRLSGMFGAIHDAFEGFNQLTNEKKRILVSYDSRDRPNPREVDESLRRLRHRRLVEALRDGWKPAGILTRITSIG